LTKEKVEGGIGAPRCLVNANVGRARNCLPRKEKKEKLESEGDQASETGPGKIGKKRGPAEPQRSTKRRILSTEKPRGKKGV